MVFGQFDIVLVMICLDVLIMGRDDAIVRNVRVFLKEAGAVVVEAEIEVMDLVLVLIDLFRLLMFEIRIIGRKQIANWGVIATYIPSPLALSVGLEKVRLLLQKVKYHLA